VPYFETQALWSNILEIQKLILWDLTLDMNKFKTAFFYSIIFNEEAEYCTGYGYEVGAISILLETSFRVSDCYKQVIQDLCDFSSTWTGYEALWLDDCSLSSETVVSLNKWDLVDEVTDEMFSGTTNPISVEHCRQLPFTPGWLPTASTTGRPVPPIVESLATNFYKAVGNLAWNKYS